MNKEQVDARRTHIEHSVKVTTPPLDTVQIAKLRGVIKDYFDTNDREPEELIHFFNLVASWQSGGDLMGAHAALLLGISDVLYDLVD